tara:strand:- start:191 stop:637 length:447 start_codon:yes stop_codon:yes gene_type:complete
MIENTAFLLIVGFLLIPLSPFLAIMERFMIGIGSIGMIFVLGVVILSSPLIFFGGIVLIVASAATTSTGLYFIAFSIVSPLILIPLLSVVNDPDIQEASGLLIITNTLLVLVLYTLVGSASPLFLPVLIAAIALVVGDLMNSRLLEEF